MYNLRETLRGPSGQEAFLAVLQETEATILEPMLPRIGIAVRRFVSGGVEEFSRGYLDAGGNPANLNHFINKVLPCESGDRTTGVIRWDANDGPYFTAAQFSSDTHAKVKTYLASLGIEMDNWNAYHVGLGVGWWSTRTNPAEQWGCW